MRLRFSFSRIDAIAQDCAPLLVSIGPPIVAQSSIGLCITVEDYQILVIDGIRHRLVVFLCQLQGFLVAMCCQEIGNAFAPAERIGRIVCRQEVPVGISRLFLLPVELQDIRHLGVEVPVLLVDIPRRRPLHRAHALNQLFAFIADMDGFLIHLQGLTSRHSPSKARPGHVRLPTWTST